MPKATHHDAVARLFELLKLLPSRGAGITARDICARLEASGFSVSKRTVERDLTELSRLFGLECNDKSQPYGWRWAQHQGLSLPGLGLTDALSLRMVEDMLRPLVPSALLESLEARFAEARQKLASLAETNPSARWADKVRHVPPALPLLPPPILAEAQAAVQDALLRDMQVEVSYQKPMSDAPTPLRLHPLGLVQRGPVAYLVATAFDYADVRLYAMHRIRAATTVDVQAKRREDFSLDAFVSAGRMQFGEGGTLRLQALVSPELASYLAETPLSRDQRISARGAPRKLTATVPDTWQLEWWILSHGPDIEILKPLRLRRQVAEALAAASARYAGERQ